MKTSAMYHSLSYRSVKILSLLCICVFVCACLLQNLQAKSSIISPIPLPQEKILDIDEHSCGDGCLKKLYTNGYVFSFLAKFSPSTTDKKLLRYFSEAMSQLNGIEIRESDNSERFTIALLIPKQLVGRYSVSVANTILAYLIAQNIDFEFRVFDCVDESKDNLESAYLRIIQSNADFVIAMLGPVGVQNLIGYENLIYPTYIPTINKERLPQSVVSALPDNVYFGGISYKEQFETLLPLMKDAAIVEYADDSQVGGYLSGIFADLGQNIKRKRSLTAQDASQFGKSLYQEERYFSNAAVMLNTAAPKTGLILSQIGLSEQPPRIYLSTQLNFNPIILQLASPKSRENLVVVSAIGNIDESLMEYAYLLNNDLRYDWVSYATSIGVEFGLRNVAKSGKSLFSESMRDKQIQYHNKLWTTKGSSFVPLK